VGVVGVIERNADGAAVTWLRRVLRLLAHVASLTAWTLGALMKIGGEQAGPYLPPDAAPKNRKQYRP